MYDIICILCNITTTFTDKKRLYSCHHIHNIPEYRTDCIRHNIHYSCDITATVTMTRHLQYFWHDPQCIWGLTRWMNDNTTTVSDMIQMYLCNQTHLSNDITPYVHMKPHPLHAWHHMHFTWHHIHSYWQHTIVSLSWHKLCFMTSYVIYMMSPILCVWRTQLYIWL